MIKQAMFGLIAMTVPICAGVSLFGCAPSEESCKLNQTFIGVGVGAAAGAGVGALISHGSTGGTLSGAVLGGAIGGLIGNQGDQACKQYALQKALQLAAERQAAAQQAAAHRPQYQTVSWANPKSGNHGAITPLNSYTDPASKEVCMSFADTDTVDGKTTNSSGRACKQPDGTWK